MNANKLELKVFEMWLNVEAAVNLYKKFICDDGFTVNDAIKLKELLDLTDLEVAEIFLP